MRAYQAAFFTFAAFGVARVHGFWGDMGGCPNVDDLCKSDQYYDESNYFYNHEEQKELQCCYGISDGDDVCCAGGCKTNHGHTFCDRSEATKQARIAKCCVDNSEAFINIGPFATSVVALVIMLATLPCYCAYKNKPGMACMHNLTATFNIIAGSVSSTCGLIGSFNCLCHCMCCGGVFVQLTVLGLLGVVLGFVSGAGGLAVGILICCTAGCCKGGDGCCGEGGATTPVQTIVLAPGGHGGGTVNTVTPMQMVSVQQQAAMGQPVVYHMGSEVVQQQQQQQPQQVPTAVVMAS